MAEIRLDSCPLSAREIDECFSSDVPLVATCRIDVIMKSDVSLQNEELSDESRFRRAAQIAEKKLSYREYEEEIRKLAKKYKI